MAEEQDVIREEIIVEQHGTSFVLKGVGGQVGEINYRLVDVDTWVIDRTHLEPEYRGRGLAKQLLDLVVQEARDNGRKIIPSCSYALEQFKANSEYADVWSKNDTELSDPYSSSSVTKG